VTLYYIHTYITFISENKMNTITLMTTVLIHDCSYYDTNIVLITMGITAGVCLAISIFAIQTKVDHAWLTV